MELTEKEKQFINEVKKKRPSLKGLLPIMHKYGFKPKNNRFKTLFLQYNIITFLKKDKTMRKIYKKSAKTISIAYKEMRSI
jgi:hypothetical protein